MPHEHSILVVDDDVATRTAMIDLLVENGFGVSTAGDGREALRILRRRKTPCLLLLDLMMPRMTGWELLELHRKGGRLSRVPLVLVTGWLETEKAQARALVPKPIDPSRLLRALRRVLAEARCGGRKTSAGRKTKRKAARKNTRAPSRS